ncbi:MAG: histidinol dehydrogenase, partial [Tissierellia bacterium]|nr:histidinol dehydrogenase [Tissierellia bacterium]
MVRLIENNIEEYIAEIQNRNLEDYREVYKEVDKILEDVRKNKDEALKK